MKRRVEPEWLDELSAADPHALRSRRDLRRINAWMGSAAIMAKGLDSCCSKPGPVRLVELGAGDGHFLSRVARRLGKARHGTRATLLDRQNLLSGETALDFRKLGWEVEAVTRDVFDWCHEAKAPAGGVVLTNLFLHHFDSEPLRELLRGIAERSQCLVALETQRSKLAAIFSRLVGLIGCNAVTRHDAPASVHAGFCGDELTRLWVDKDRWIIREQPAGPFSHLFVAQQRSDERA